MHQEHNAKQAPRLLLECKIMDKIRMGAEGGMIIRLRGEKNSKHRPRAQHNHHIGSRLLPASALPLTSVNCLGNYQKCVCVCKGKEEGNRKNYDCEVVVVVEEDSVESTRGRE